MTQEALWCRHQKAVKAASVVHFATAVHTRRRALRGRLGVPYPAASGPELARVWRLPWCFDYADSGRFSVVKPPGSL